MVVMSGWGGDPKVNQWITEELAPFVEKTAGVKLQWSPMNIDEILAKLEHEKQAGVTGTIDVVWINGENFRYAKANGLLHESFLETLPNARAYLDLDDKKNCYDFGLPTDGSESPWGRAQFIFAADTEKVPHPPKNARELKTFLEANPGAFTYPESDDFVASAFLRTLVYDIAGYDAIKDVPADYDAIARVIAPVLDYLNAIEPLLWRKGATYPKTVAQLDELFQDGTIYITMDYNSYKSYAQVNEGLWPLSARTFVWDSGTPSNTHFLAIPENSAAKEAALKVIDAALSPGMQASKAKLSGWGDAPVIDFSRLTETEKALFNTNATGLNPAAYRSLLADEELAAHAMPELSGDVVVIIEKLWQERVLLR
ncbi:ABC transporter substrate-binding protein [Spirochaetia bacterium]|nr:ABC transporter substrate-binding protein [Spirochaetia bacterium]